MLAQIVLYDGFDPLDALLPYEVLSAGGTLSGGKVEAELVSAEGPREVRSGFEAIRLSASAALDPSRADVIVVPGAAGSLPDGDEPAEDSILGYLQRAVGSALTGLMAEALDRRGVTVTTVTPGRSGAHTRTARRQVFRKESARYRVTSATRSPPG